MIAPLNNFIGKQPLAHIATNTRAINDMADAVNKLRNLNFDQKYFSVSATPGGIFVTVRAGEGAAADDDKATFRCVQTAPNKVMVYAGTIRHHGLGHWSTIDTEVTLSGSEYIWIFVCFARDASANPYIDQQIDEPISDTSTIRIPLTYWHQISENVYERVKTAHKYDVHMGNPLI